MNETTNRRGRLQLVLLAAVFLGPLAVAAWLYYSPAQWAPDGRTNNGMLLQPVIVLPEVALADGSGGETAPGALRGRWSLTYLARSDCAETCRSALNTIRQIRLGSGKEALRIQRVLLSDSALPEAAWLAAEQAGLIVARPGSDASFSAAVAELDEGIYLVDPLGNLMMAYPADAAPKPVYADLKKLLKNSRIG
ncbi:MAG: hypothetical protein AAFX58_06185 [Pseudomonadota bacterium]